MSTSHVPRIHVGRPRGNPWLVAAVALAAALLGLGAWVIVDRARSESAGAAESSRGLASDRVAAMLEARIAAWDRGDGGAAAALYTEDAVMEERDITPAFVSEGREAIGNRLQELIDLGLRMRGVGAPVQLGRFVGEPVRFYAAEGGPAWRAVGEGMLVFELSAGGKIAHQWVMGEVRG